MNGNYTKHSFHLITWIGIEVCLASVYGERISINIGGQDLKVDLRETGKFSFI